MFITSELWFTNAQSIRLHTNTVGYARTQPKCIIFADQNTLKEDGLMMLIWAPLFFYSCFTNCFCITAHMDM